MAAPSPNQGITLLIIDQHAGMAELVGDTLAARLPGVRIVRSASRAGADTGPEVEVSEAGEPDLIVWNLADDSPERIGALGLFLEARPEAPTVVIVPACAPGLVSVVIQAGAADAVVRTAEYIEQLAAVVMKHAVLIGAAGVGSGVRGGRSAAESGGKAPRGPDGTGGAPLSDLRRVRDAVEALRRENDSLRELVSQLRDAANTDVLTGLGNARHLDARLEEMFAACRRYGGDLSCLMLDLDGLKAVNDALGHGAGDELLRTTADVIRRCTRRCDASARAGGDEFVILLPRTDAAQAQRLAERLQRELAASTAELFARLGSVRPRLRLAGRPEEDERSATRRLGASIGVASVSLTEAGSGRELVAAADSAMYEAKARGRGLVMVWGDAGLRAA